MMNSSIHDILAINISELSKDQLANIEQKLMQSNQKLPVLLAENLITSPFFGEAQDDEKRKARTM